ncbi:hypothetical protein DICPUDRAFT_153563 [Dictyostelium purpureum]|uniref:Saposin B-type domain-containing protein n=1 Tax=Dictyostelium purpureum TaxID=5786 RepID=F0ZP74_DICPU|nr:uncharacterized protein DICPUDRAFT_153563 [Dictyostelium purpureum]EGC34254.1 hypothetical protein DICPUDRAFT_153563 [Dictyostelium purpureum]|eukprot:XP_003289223.1 hypothetical protein DICPUDRAFT_153563 [Dictyostelium purpureum]
MKLNIVLLVFVLISAAIVSAVNIPINTNKEKPEQQGFKFDYSIFQQDKLSSANGGSHCAGCTIALTLVEQYSYIHNKTIEQSLDEICTFFPSNAGQVCIWLVNTYGKSIIQNFEKYEHADDVCHAMNICTSPECRLFPSNTPTYSNPEHKHEEYDASNPKVSADPWSWIQNLINLFSSKHLPIEDIDNDKYSMESTFRGYSWRGKDCNDLRSDIHPGINEETTTDPSIDWNCNGIYGVNNKSQSYEDLFCSGSGPMGVIVSGDSAGAHFSIPPQWMTASQINSTTYNGFLSILENEVDWPMRSAYTGWEPSTDTYTVDSMYLRMRERNFCNHRDYQNLGVNGASSGSTATKIIQSLSRNQQTDNPALFFLELIGNDVCSGHHTYDTMTTPQEFETNIVSILNYLDTQLPKGSHVVFVGLADGRVLWDSLWNRTHPLGATYEEVYDFLNCIQVSPCWGWMNPNETVRDFTSTRAAELSAVYNQIIKNYTFTNFDMIYYDFPFNAINAQWVAQGGQTWELIEPIDGFHPNQITNYLMASFFYNSLTQDKPEWLGNINPFNSQIQAIFGNQGGYV